MERVADLADYSDSNDKLLEHEDVYIAYGDQKTWLFSHLRSPKSSGNKVERRREGWEFSARMIIWDPADLSAHCFSVPTLPPTWKITD